ncbi:transmembrane signal receptor [Lithospermum erythrorhizon]|uniref:Transmembrane signal receptor n=1 Tax=Lithospermum erythrorhizon TaxID=34254 RepID=A0AAV3QQB1_LITER
MIMKSELDALEANETCDIVSLPSGHKPIGCKWVYKVKCNPDGNVNKYKARLVAKGYNQIEGVDYFDSFSPVAKTVTVRMVLALAVVKGWKLNQLDINNAFLHDYLNGDIYMALPPGYQLAAPSQVRKLKRSLYGLKQASRQWNQEFTSQILSYGFTQSHHDNCFFVMSTPDVFLVLIVYVDDILLTGSSEDAMESVKRFLDEQFTIKDLGTAKYFLGLEIAKSQHGMFITQQKYIKDIIQDMKMVDAKAVVTPLASDWHPHVEGSHVLSDPTIYGRLVGRLLYLNFSRPDLTFSVNLLSQFMQVPTENHWSGALHVC